MYVKIKGISIHAPRAGSDPIAILRLNVFHHFNPRSPCGERHDNSGLQPQDQDFNPRSPCGERRCIDVTVTRDHEYFNPRSPCGERLVSINDSKMEGEISIHAPRAGSDASDAELPRHIVISIHAPRAGRD